MRNYTHQVNKHGRKHYDADQDNQSSMKFGRPEVLDAQASQEVAIYTDDKEANHPRGQRDLQMWK
jgi:hypothetical protein